MASGLNFDARRSVSGHERTILGQLIFVIIAIGALAWAAIEWISADENKADPAAPIPKQVATVKAAKAKPGNRPPVEAKQAPPARHEPATKIPSAAPKPRPAKRKVAAAAMGSVAALRKAAMAGDAERQYQLGRAYLAGAGVKTDPIEAVAWFIQAAARGHTLARGARDHQLARLEKNDRIAAAYKSRALGPIIPAGWLKDADSGTAVWLPSWFRNGIFRLKLDVAAANGRAEGDGRPLLTAGLRGYFTDRDFKGQFRRGYYFGKQAMTRPFEMLPTDAYLVRLPDSGSAAFKGSQFWVHNRFGVKIAIHICRRRAVLLAVMTKGDTKLDDAAGSAVIDEAARIYAGFCPKSKSVDVTVLPALHQRMIDRGRTTFTPKLAEAGVDGLDTGAFEIFHFKNHAAAAP